MSNEDKIKELTSWFFDRINIPIIEGLYIHNEKVRDALCASLTFLGDLQRAKTEYYGLTEVNHLEAIGIIQTIYIEQDCMLNLKNAVFDTNEKSALYKYKPFRQNAKRKVSFHDIFLILRMRLNN